MTQDNVKSNFQERALVLDYALCSLEAHVIDVKDALEVDTLRPSLCKLMQVPSTKAGLGDTLRQGPMLSSRLFHLVEQDINAGWM